MPDYWGIDIGKSGAFARLKSNGVLEALDMPVWKEGAKKGYNVDGLVSLVADWLLDSPEDGVVCMVECPLAMPGQNVTATGSQFMGAGLVDGVLASVARLLPQGRRLQVMHTRPVDWTRRMFVGVDKDMGKKRSAIVAAALFPREDKLWTGPRGAVLDGRADALLLAEFGRRVHGGLNQ